MRKHFVTVAALLLAGCVSMGTNYDAAAVDRLRVQNMLGTRDAVPEQFGEVPTYTYIAGGSTDIHPVASNILEGKIKRVHSLIWAGGTTPSSGAFSRRTPTS